MDLTGDLIKQILVTFIHKYIIILYLLKSTFMYILRTLKKKQYRLYKITYSSKTPSKCCEIFLSCYAAHLLILLGVHNVVIRKNEIM